MRARVHHPIVDCPDPRALATFWSRLLDQPGAVYADPAGHPFCLIPRPHGAPPLG